MSVEAICKLIKEHSSQIIVFLFALLLMSFALMLISPTAPYLLAGVMLVNVLVIISIVNISKD